jgi:hypothetical protein
VAWAAVEQRTGGRCVKVTSVLTSGAELGGIEGEVGMTR